LLTRVESTGLLGRPSAPHDAALRTRVPVESLDTPLRDEIDLAPASLACAYEFRDRGFF